MILKSAGIHHPMTVAFVALACGICCVENLSAATFCLCLLGLLFSRQRLPHIAVGLALGCFAALLVPQTIWIEGEHKIEGRVISSGFEHGQFRIEIDDLNLDGRACRGRARLNVYQASSLHGRHTPLGTHGFEATHISAPVTLKPPRPLGNEGEFDYARHLRSEGITMTGYIKGWDSVFIGTAATGRAVNFRQSTARASNILSDLARPEAEIIKAMLWGDRSYLTYAAQDNFAALGLSHLIAISGLNIGLIVILGYVLAYTVLRCQPRLAERVDTPLVAKITGLACAVLFAVIVEPSYPTTRAVIMSVMVVTALVFARRAALIDALALSGCIILVIWPLSLFSPGFQLSFAAVLGLIVVLERLEGAHVLIQILAVPVVASAFTLPIAAYVFGFIAPLGILFNVIFVPLFSFMALPLGLLGLATSFLSEPIAAVCFAWAMDVIALILWTGEHFGRLVPVPRPPIVWVYLCYLGLILAFLGSWRLAGKDLGVHIRPLVLGCICLALIMVPLGQYYHQRKQPLMFDFISVGQGDSILVTKGLRAVLIDAGGTHSGFDTGRFVIGPHLLQRGITRLDLIVLTHSHPDHAGGMPFILERFGARQVWTNVVHDQGFQDVTRISSLKSIPVRAVCRGETLKINDIKIEVLHPQIRQVQSAGLDLNLHSVVLRIGDAHMTGLFMADAHRFGELTVVHGDADLRADVLKAAHHGSARSCQEALLEAIRPSLAVITCGYHNHYGMPDPDVLARLRENGAAIFRTDLNAEVQIFVKHGRIAVKSMACPAEEGNMFSGPRCM